ncbi:MAG: hypothetical protein QW327_06185 [Candidatus Odinarchaeota archaeon]
MSTKDESKLEQSLIEIKNVLQENIKNFSKVKEALEKFGLSVIDRLGLVQNQLDEFQKNISKLDSLEVSIRGLRFTTKETLEKLIDRVLELEKIVKSKPSVEGIVVQEIEEPQPQVKETARGTVRQEANKTATENTLNSLGKAVREQLTAGELINKIAETRDTLMSWVPHHPVFYEMHEWIQKIKHLPKNKPIPPEYANKLLKELDSWLNRIVKE